MKKPDIAFGTLALGQEYRILSMLLAYDLSVFHPENKMYILTDKLSAYTDKAFNVIPIKHNFGGVRRCFHDKRYVIEKILEKHDVCIFLDADCRITSKINFSEITHDNTFILSIMMESLEKKFEIKKINASKPMLNSPKKISEIFKRLASFFDVQYADIYHISECFFVIQKQHGNYKQFLKIWDYLSKYLATRLYETGEGSSIGIASLACQSQLKQLNYIPSWLFNDEYTYFKSKDVFQKQVEMQLASLRKNIKLECRHRNNIKFFKIFQFILRYCLNVFRFIKKRREISKTF